MSQIAPQTFPRSFRTLLLAVSVEPHEVGQRIARAREQRGWTQEVFAREANVSLSTVQRWEAGKLPPVRELIRIAGVLGVSTDQLVEPGEPTVGEEAVRRAVRAELADVVDLLRRLEEHLVGQEDARAGGETP